jgi:hypothetical protein
MAAAVASGVLLTPASALAGKWIDAPAATVLSEPLGVGSPPVVALNASGAEATAWYEGTAIRVRLRPPGGGPFGAPVTVTNPPPSGGNIGGPSVAIDAAGDVLVTWTEYDGAGHYGVAFASAAAGQPLGKGTLIPSSVGAVPRQVQPLFLSDGTALIAWAGFEGPLEVIRRPPGGEFGAPIAVTPEAVTGFAAVPESGDRALLAWSEVKVVTVGMERTTTYSLKSADLSAAGAVSGRQTIGFAVSIYTPSCSEPFVSCSSTTLGDVHAAADPAGDGLISYIAATESGGFSFGTTSVVKAAYRVGGGGFEEPASFPSVTTTLSSISQTSGVAPDGTALVAWEDGGFGSGAIRFAQRARIATFPAAGQVLALAPSSAPAIVALGEEGALLAYVHGGKEVLAQALTVNGPHGPAVALSGTNTSVIGPVLAGDGGGDAAAAWEGIASGSLYTVQSAAYDAGPRLSGLSVPASGLTGAALPFAVTPTDPLSPVSARWTFGDGAQATGTSVTHTYSAAGAQIASVVAVDAAGLESQPLTGVTQVLPATCACAPGLGRTPPAKGATTLSLKILRQRLHDLLTKGLAVTVGCSAPCVLNVAMQIPPALARALGLIGAGAGGRHGRSVGIGSSSRGHAARRGHHARPGPVAIGQMVVRLPAGGTKTVHVKLTTAAQLHLRHVRSLTLSVIEAAIGANTPRPLTGQVVLR